MCLKKRTAGAIAEEYKNPSSLARDRPRVRTSPSIENCRRDIPPGVEAEAELLVQSQ